MFSTTAHVSQAMMPDKALFNQKISIFSLFRKKQKKKRKKKKTMLWHHCVLG